MVKDNIKSSKTIGFKILMSTFIIINIFIVFSIIEIYNLSIREKEIKKLNNEIEEIQKIDEEIKMIKKNYDDKNTSNENLKTEVNTLDSEIKELTFKIDKLENILEK